ncbi:MAG: pyridoxal-phosphate dependent enzyme [Vicinamibacterales bacterium]|jgi:1-aminocyclopropane-1-carboxylate deaminase/D-cysteine desulfhydrase-like pyridoxal-dependent ACC family enzyme|nr:pyridoxal-phosphate dependent enzyme [Vicinamibacterales bacterium]MDP6608082.1 pyridoxal-phosphate dependent enzyme [Vicinamibacterales bacterium]
MSSGLPNLESFVASLPRLTLGQFPTPLVKLGRLGDRLDLDLWLKRDECAGLAVGGNKTRKLEFILADAMAKGHDTIVTAGPVTSNHTMMTAMAARRVGLTAHCVVGGERPRPLSGNLLLLDYLGATLHFSPADFRAPTAEGVHRHQALCREVVDETGGYWIPGGGTMPQAEPAYMNAVAEIARQRGGVFDFDRVVLAIGTGSTTTGVLLGLALGGFDCRVDAVATANRAAIEEVFKRPDPTRHFLKSVTHFDLPLGAADVPPYEIVFGFAEEGYSVPSAGGDRAIRTMAREEGYLLDPVYTAKAFDGLMTMVGDGRIPKGSRVLFLHTGGLSMTSVSDQQFAPPPV